MYSTSLSQTIDSLLGKQIDSLSCYSKTKEILWLISSSHLSNAQYCLIDNVNTVLAYNNTHIIEYIAILDTNFNLHKKFHIGMSYQEVAEIEKGEIIKLGWMAYQVLSSGWCVVFNDWEDAKDNSSNWELPKSKWKVKFFFKRK